MPTLLRTGDPTYDLVLLGAGVFVLVVALAAPFFPSPYGRFAPAKGGLALDPRWGWFLMELPATLSFLWFFFHGARWNEPVRLLFLGVWLVHYGNRGFLFPLLMRVPRGATATFGALVIGFGWVATGLHGYLHGAFLGGLGPHLDAAWLTDPRFLVGITVYYASFAGNLWSDAILRNLRSREEVERGEKVYRIPTGGLFEWVTCPSYLTELTGWAGLALATWSPAGLFIFALSAANLVPRARDTHRWYRERFPDYPAKRRALVPGVW